MECIWALFPDGAVLLLRYGRLAAEPRCLPPLNHNDRGVLRSVPGKGLDRVCGWPARGALRYGFIAPDLARCEDQLPADLPDVPSEARFDQAEVVLAMDNKEKRFPLRNSRMR
jgi:hypothetical protein